MANFVKEFFRELKANRDKRRQQEVDNRWLYEFTEIYTYRVEGGYAREEADKRFGKRRDIGGWNISAAWWGIDDAELNAMRADVHTAVDEVLQQLDHHGGAWRDDVCGERPFEKSEREHAVYRALLAAGRPEHQKEEAIEKLRDRFGRQEWYDPKGTA